MELYVLSPHEQDAARVHCWFGRFEGSVSGVAVRDGIARMDRPVLALATDEDGSGVRRWRVWACRDGEPFEVGGSHQFDVHPYYLDEIPIHLFAEAGMLEVPEDETRPPWRSDPDAWKGGCP